MSNARITKTTKISKFAEPVIKNVIIVHVIMNRVISISPAFLVKIFSAIIKKTSNPIGITATLIFTFRGDV